MIVVRYVSSRCIVKLVITLCCPVAGFILWLYLHRRVNRNIVDVELVLRCIDVISEVGIMLTIILLLWMLWVHVAVVVR